jgi:hypothetical protein
VLFRGDFRLQVRFEEIKKVEVDDGWLLLRHSRGLLALELGSAATAWATKILHPPSRVDKLGIKPGLQVVLVGIEDSDIGEEIKSRGAELSSKPTAGSDVLIVAVEKRAGLKKLSSLQTFLKPKGCIWVVYPRGVAAVTEMDVLKAGRDAGLVDVKVARFSDTHTALKFVIPVARR